MKRYAVYRRVSTEEQSRPGHVSLDAQLVDCQRHVLSQGGGVVISEHDVLSGLKTARPGYQRIKEAARRREIDAVVAFDFSRWGRNAAESISSFQELRSLGVTVETVRQTTEDPFLQNLYAILAYRDSQEISAKTVAGLRYRATKGEWSGAPPIGYKVQRENGVSKLVPDHKAPMVTRLFNEAATGIYSLAELSEMAKGWGIRGRTGHYLSRQALGKILRNPTYRGAVVYGRKSFSEFRLRGPQPVEDWIVTENAHPAIVDLAVFNLVQSTLSGHRENQGTVRGTKHILTSLVYCGVCAGVPGPNGEARVWRMYGHGTKGRAYECSRRSMYGECTLPTITAAPFEARIKADLMTQFTIAEDLRIEAAAFVEAEIEDAQSAVDHQRRNLLRDLDKHQGERMELARQRLGLAGNTIPEDVYQKLEAQAALAVSTIERELSGLPKSPDSTDVGQLLGALTAVNWTNFEDEDWRDLLALLVKRITVYSRSDFIVEWMPSADILRRAVARVSR